MRSSTSTKQIYTLTYGTISGRRNRSGRSTAVGVVLLWCAAVLTADGAPSSLAHQLQCSLPGHEFRDGLCLPCSTGFYKATSDPGELCQPCSTRGSNKYTTLVCPCNSTRDTLFGCTNDNYIISGVVKVCTKQAVVEKLCPNEHSQTTNALPPPSRSSSAPSDFALTAAAEPPMNATTVFATPPVTEVTAAATKTLEASVVVNVFFSLPELIGIVLAVLTLVLISVGLALLAKHFLCSPTLIAKNRMRPVDPSRNTDMMPGYGNSMDESSDSPRMNFIDPNTDVSETASLADSDSVMVSDDSYNSTQQEDVQVLGETEMSRLSPPPSSDWYRPQHVASGGQSLPDQYGSSHSAILRTSSEMPANGVDSVLPNL